MILYAFTDGASRGNPGESGIGVLVKDEAGNVVLSFNGYIGRTTNNVAEYTALTMLLDRAMSLSCKKLVAHSDSELMVRQINKVYKVKDANLREQYQRVTDLIGRLPFAFELQHVPREQNKEADMLANEAIDFKKELVF